MNSIDNIHVPFASSITRGPVPRWQRKLLDDALSPKKPATPKVHTHTRTYCIASHAHVLIIILTRSSSFSLHTLQGDRFIPNRAAMNVEACQFNVAGESTWSEQEMVSSPKAEYQRSVQSLLMGEAQGSKILSFKTKAPVAADDSNHEMRVVYSQNKGDAGCKKSVRHIAQTPDRVLDAPELRPDYYLNLIDWSSQNLVSVALGDVCH